MKTIKWGIIGCGAVCEVKSGPGFQQAENSGLVAVMRRDAEKAKDFAERHGVPKWYSDAHELINDPEVNAIYIATPPKFHLEYVRLAAPSGKPIYVEKPMGRNYAECLEMIEICESAGVPLFVAYYRQRLPYFLKVKSILDSGVIGTPTSLSLELFKSPKPNDNNPAQNWRVDPDVSGGGYFHDLASHQFDLLEFLFGEIESASGSSNSSLLANPAEDFVSATFKFSSGLVGTGNWNFAVNPDQVKDEMLIQGTKGSIRFGFFNGDIPIIVETDAGQEKYQVPYPPHVQQPLIQSIVDELRDEGKCPSSGRTASRANWVMDQVLGRI
ncbi:MAG: Gfo/Idh/MocA family oxidoreductase [Balneolaceae bacterium]|nr:Gfo/Idh/MocA family oxidoreductase [Balneolaceae bacterium]